MTNFNYYYGSVYDRYETFKQFVFTVLEKSLPYKDLVNIMEQDNTFNSVHVDIYELDYDGIEGSCYSKWKAEYDVAEFENPTITFTVRGYSGDTMYEIKNLETSKIKILNSDETERFYNVHQEEIDKVYEVKVLEIQDKFEFWVNQFKSDLIKLYPDYELKFIFSMMYYEY